MKTITYHYVRTRNADMPKFIYLDSASFEKQLDYFEANGGIISRSEFLDLLTTGRLPKSKFLLTFDDGLIEHFHVAKSLKQRNALGLFYISTGPLCDQKPLGVHITHALLGCVAPELLLTSIRHILKNSQVTHLGEFTGNTYLTQDSPPALTQVKRLLNYQIPYAELSYVLEELCRLHAKHAAKFAFEQYLSHSEIRDMEEMGMIVGAHSVSHRSLARLSEKDWQKEIFESLRYIETIKSRCNPLSFAYPYGGAHNYHHSAPQYLEDQDCEFSFDVNHRDTTEADLVSLRHALPRFDCNQFAHGKASGVH